MWTPSRRGVLQSLLVGGAIGTYAAGRLWCHESGCGNEQTAYLVGSPIDPAWKFDYYDPAWYLQNDPGNEVTRQARLAADKEQVFVKRGNLASFEASGEVRNWGDKGIPFRPNPEIALTETRVVAYWYDTDAEQGVIQGFDKSDGENLWKRGFSDEELERVVTSREAVAWLSGSTFRVLDTETGADNVELNDLSGIGDIAGYGQYMYLLRNDLVRNGDEYSRVTAVNAVSGEEEWSFRIQGKLRWVRATQHGVFIGNQKTLARIDPEDGTGSWKYGISETNAPEGITAENGALILYNPGQHFYVLDAVSGEYQFGSRLREYNELKPRATSEAIFVPYTHDNNPALPEVGEGLYRFDRKTGEYDGRRIFDSYFRDTAVSEDIFYTINDTSLWAFN